MLLEGVFYVPGVPLPLGLAACVPIRMRLVHCRVVLEEHVHGKRRLLCQWEVEHGKRRWLW
jgi:hypothetical protein